ncbi:HpcH/HpaI aldolase/citrate lyase family protein [Pararhodobacter zhoushanensis]|uniref:CoA ester lyase n=1 Tax=Pararhodobacter zhoushanensis TaxID=2479545 RepID=A0ABT3GU58_9RHOB|nr:CoA ester lyase [Pararhodobacter zhoushanensis]MCW1931070.1 CoA ester lyase [Pararhodobacter zhoushanensis]
MDSRPFRSALYIPGSKERALDKARSLAADAIIFDLEDAVAIEEKANARELLAQTLTAADYGPRAKLVRINGFDTDWGDADLAVIALARPEAVLLPKVNSARDIQALAAKLEGREETSETKIWAMMETPLGILNAQEIAAAPRMAGFVMGTNDLAKELNCRFRADRLPMQFALQTCLMAARAAGIVAIDGVYNAFKDDAGLRVECEQGRDLGFDGKTLIHPAQLDVANAVFAPDEAAIDLARRQIAAFDEATAKGLGVAVVDGKIVENLHIVTARGVLARADAILQLQKAMS